MLICFDLRFHVAYSDNRAIDTPVTVNLHTTVTIV